MFYGNFFYKFTYTVRKSPWGSVYVEKMIFMFVTSVYVSKINKRRLFIISLSIL